MSGDTIRVCEGDYTENTLTINVSVTITGPGATTADDGVAIVHHGGGSSALIDIRADGVTLEGLDLDLTPPSGFTADTLGIASAANYVTIQDNEIHNATSLAVSAHWTPTPTNVSILRNNVHDNGPGGIACYCDDSGLWSNTVDAGGGTALSLNGDRGTIGGNVVTNGLVIAAGNDLVVQDNQISAGTANSTLSVSGNPVTVTNNNLSDAISYGIDASPGMVSGTSLTIGRNTFTQVRIPICLADWDPSDGLAVTATIGGSPAEANTFVDSGGTLGDLSYLVEMDGPTAGVNAEHNNWGLCTAAEIEQEIYHQVDDPAQGLVDFEPFIAPGSCSAPTPTPTPTPTPGLTPEPTPDLTPTPTRAVTIPAQGWANFAWTGASSAQEVVDCFGEDKIAVMYRLNAETQAFERWVRGREELSTMGDVAQFDALLALNGSGESATCEMPDPSPVSPRTLIIPANSWANFAWTGFTSAQEVADCFGEGKIAVMYRLDAGSQSFQRWIGGREDLSNVEDVARFDVLLAVNASGEP
ncbi:MAG: hypothetical protein AMJ76_03695, partial [Dehalococcoidia bacterium SM23_28_1]